MPRATLASSAVGFTAINTSCKWRVKPAKTRLRIKVLREDVAEVNDDLPVGGFERECLRVVHHRAEARFQDNLENGLSEGIFVEWLEKHSAAPQRRSNYTREEAL